MASATYLCRDVLEKSPAGSPQDRNAHGHRKRICRGRPNLAPAARNEDQPKPAKHFVRACAVEMHKSHFAREFTGKMPGARGHTLV